MNNFTYSLNQFIPYVLFAEFSKNCVWMHASEFFVIYWKRNYEKPDKEKQLKTNFQYYLIVKFYDMKFETNNEELSNYCLLEKTKGYSKFYHYDLTRMGAKFFTIW